MSRQTDPSRVHLGGHRAFRTRDALPIQLPTIKFGEDSQRDGGVLLGDPGAACGYWYYIDAAGRVVALPSAKATDVVVAGPRA
jgi:hypothetical protein